MVRVVMILRRVHEWSREDPTKRRATPARNAVSMNGGCGLMKYGEVSTGSGYGARPVRPTISHQGSAAPRPGSGLLQSRFPMMDFLEQTIRGLFQFGQDALMGGNVWILMFVALVGIGVITAVRGRLTESWLWIPILALAMWYSVYRWLQVHR